MIAVAETVGINLLGKTLLDAVPTPVFLLDEEVRVTGFNSSAGRILKRTQEVSSSHEELLDCIHAPHASTNCGRSNQCDGCFIRTLVFAAFAGQDSVREQALVRLVTPAGRREIEIHASAKLVVIDGHRGVLLTLEELTEPALDKRLVPICAKCKRIRDDREHWDTLEHYLRDSQGVRFTHGLCPDCLSSSLAQVGMEIDG